MPVTGPPRSNAASTIAARRLGSRSARPRPDDGFELRADGRLQMMLFGAIAPARIRTTARVDRAFALRSFEFLLDRGNGPIEVRGALDGRRIRPDRHDQGRNDDGEPRAAGDAAADGEPGTPAGERRPRAGRPSSLDALRPYPASQRRGRRGRWKTRAHSDSQRHAVRFMQRVMVPAFRVELDFAGLRTTSWITDTGEVLREGESGRAHHGSRERAAGPGDVGERAHGSPGRCSGDARHEGEDR